MCTIVVSLTITILFLNGNLNDQLVYCINKSEIHQRPGSTDALSPIDEVKHFVFLQEMSRSDNINSSFHAHHIHMYNIIHIYYTCLCLIIMLLSRCIVIPKDKLNIKTDIRKKSMVTTS